MKYRLKSIGTIYAPLFSVDRKEYVRSSTWMFRYLMMENFKEIKKSAALKSAWHCHSEIIYILARKEA